MRRLKKKSLTEYYSLEFILSLECHYNMIFGERSNGKTYAVLLHGLETFWSIGKEMVYLRRWDEDFTKGRGDQVFENLVANHEVEHITNGEYNTIIFRRRKWYLAFADDEKVRLAERPFCYAMSITSMEHDKSTAYPNVTTILFDEFLSRGSYLPDEFIKFMNVISTIIRHRNDVTIFLCGNTVNKYCPYFKEMGIYRIKNMEPGTVDVYTYGETQLKVAVEYCGEVKVSGKSSEYFAFDNPKLQMITGGAWELALYPHCPVKYRPKDVVFVYFICFEDDILQCEIISFDNSVFTYIHRKTTPIKDEDNDLIFSPDYSYKPNWHRRLSGNTSELERRLYAFFRAEKVFYQDNEVGEIVRNYLLWCNRSILPD